MYGENFKNLGLNQKQNVKRSILDNYGTVNQQMIDDANDFLSGLTQASKKELGRAKNPNFLNAQRISKLNPGDSAFGNYDKFWSRKMSSGEDGQKALLERIANQDLPRNTQSFEGLDRAVQNIKDLLDSSQGGQVRGGMFGGVDTFDAIKAQIVADTKMPIEEFLAKLFPDEWILSWKWEIRQTKDLNYNEPRGRRTLRTVENVTPPKDCKICVFHGDPNPEYCQDPWVKENWR